MRSSAFSWHLLMMICLTTIILLSLMSLHGVMCTRPCLSHQQSLLVQLNNSLIFDTDFDYKALQWNLSTDCCTWEGVTCEEGRIIGLNLSSKSIFGGLTDNSGLFHFQYLQSLDLSNNDFGGTPIPSRFGNLTSLIHLNLSSSGFVGPIPFELSRLTNLSTVQLDDNPFSAPVPRFLANFSKLTFLSLIGCDLHGTFPKEIFQVPTLETIDLSWNELLQGSLPEFSLNNSLQNLALGGSSFSGRLPSSINNLSKLSTLDLYACHFNETLPYFMLPKLDYLNLANNKFIGPIPSFRFSKNLERIILSNNSLSGAIPPAHWEGLPNLDYVDLGNNLFNGTLPTSLFRVPSLSVITLSHNQFGGQLPEFPNASSSILGFINLRGNNLEGPIPMSMFQLKKLFVLSLSFNKLNGIIKLDVVKGLVELNYLDLSFNNLSVEANATTWSSLPKNFTELYLASCKLTIIPHLKNQSNLHYLDLSDNEIQGVVPNWIWDLGSLGYLNLSRNYLVGIQEPYALPSSLNILDLHSNQIRGKMPTIPQPIQYIDFSSNNFDFSFPAEIGIEDPFSYGLAITYLSLSHNGINGVIPESICNMSSLQLLDLSSNNLTGRIPECMSSMERLGVLNLQRNRLSGVIPASFPVDCRLRTLDLNGNSLQGQIPKSLANCTELEVLDLGNNNLIDKFPCFSENIFALHVLILRSNKFHGSIGCSNANDTWAKLQIIDLAHNSFSGELSRRNFTNWKAMMSGGDDAQRKLNHLQVELYRWYYEDSTTVTIKGHDMYLVKILTIDICIDFSSNNFSGQIPEELGALALLYVLNLSNNAFSGPIPWSLGKLQSLESLDLSRNELNGTIPTSLANLNFLSHLDLSFNKLVGRIPSGSQFQTFEATSFQGNQGLCGFPLATNCTDEGAQDHITPAEDDRSDNSETKIDWNIISMEIGFIVGFVSIIGPLVFCKRLREMFFETMEDVAYRILPLSVTRKWLSWTTAR